LLPGSSRDACAGCWSLEGVTPYPPLAEANRGTAYLLGAYLLARNC